MVKAVLEGFSPGNDIKVKRHPEQEGDAMMYDYRVLCLLFTVVLSGLGRDL